MGVVEGDEEIITHSVDPSAINSRQNWTEMELERSHTNIYIWLKDTHNSRLHVHFTYGIILMLTLFV